MATNRALDRAIDRVVRQMAGACCAKDEAKSREMMAGALPAILDALRLIDGVVGNCVDKEKFRWVAEQAMHRLFKHVADRMGRSKALDADLRTAVVADLHETFDAVMGDFDRLL